MPQAYENAGVSVEAGYEVVRRIGKHVARTSRPGVMGGIGGFGGLFDLSGLGYREPVLVSGTDGVGTKLMVAQAMGRFDTIGIDCVAMCVNDIVAQGAEPLYFLDYIACGHNDPVCLERVVSGVADGCEQAGCALIGGETAEMPGMYAADEIDLAGFAVGVVEKSSLIDGASGATGIKAGDTLIALPSSGVHSNGFSLARKALFNQAGYTVDTPFDAVMADDGDRGVAARPRVDAQSAREDGIGTAPTLGDVLLTPTRIYVKALMPLVRAGLVKGVAHITGGGFIENVPRMLPQGLAAQIDLGTWPVPPIFGAIERAGCIDCMEMYNIFNMGVGMMLAVGHDEAQAALSMLRSNEEEAYRVGEVVVRNDDGVRVVFSGPGLAR